MSIFRSIMNKIFRANALEASASASTPSTGAPGAPAQGTEVAGSASSAAAAAIDVEAVLTELAGQKGGGGNWRTSIVDLLKLLDLDPGLEARKELAFELGVHAGADGSAEQNIALQKAVMAKLAENGGKVPDSLRT